MVGDFSKKMIWLVCLVVVFSTTFALGQGIVAGNIAGTVVDPQKAVIAGAKVGAKNVATSVEFKATTNDQGYFSIRSIPPGIYRVAVEAPNFKRLDIDGVEVNTGATTDMGALTMALGTTAETVTVEATAPLIETSSAQGGATFSSAATTDLPLNGGFDQAVLFIPGVVNAGNAGYFAGENGASFGANGQRDRSNTFQIDGQFNNDTGVTGPAIFFTNQDAIQELQVVTNNFGVEYGRTSGATVNYVTKSGTNNFHGTGFEYFTGDWGNSLTHLENVGNGGTGIVPRYTENRWGGTLGGPIVPQKIFFFTSFQQDTAKGSSSPSITSLLTPTPAGLATLAECYPSGTPGSAAVAVLKAIGPYSIAQGNPAPLAVSNGGLYPVGGSEGVALCPGVEFQGVTRSLPAIYNDYEAIARVDMVLSPRDNLFVRYLFTQPIYAGSNGALAQFSTAAEAGTEDAADRNQQAAVDWTRNWTNHLVNQVRFSYMRAFAGYQNGDYPGCGPSSLSACPSFYYLRNGLSQIGLGVNLPQAGLTNNSQWQDNASWQHGRHLVKFGGEYDRQRAPNIFLPYVNGRYTFSLSGESAAQTFTDFLAQNPSSVNLTAGSATIPFKEQDADLYLGDDWRIKENLTLNLGVRWEFEQQAINLLSAETIARQTGPNPFWNTSLPQSVTTVPPAPNHYDHFAPDIGFAWTPHMFESLLGHDKTVVRGGFRLAYDPSFYNIFLNVASAAPAVNAGTFNCGPTAIPATATCPYGATGAAVQAALLSYIPTGGNPGLRSTTRISPTFTNPYAEEWSLGIQREISSKVAAEVRYLGTHTVHEFQTVNGNPVLCYYGGPGAPCTEGLYGNFPALVPSGVTPCLTTTAPGYGANNSLGVDYANCSNTLYRLRENGATGKYHSLQSQLKLQNWHGLTLGAAYTYSRNEDNASEIFSTYGPSPVAGPQNPFCTGKCEWGLSALDYPHNLTVFWQYALPFGKGQTNLLGRVLGGWALGGTYHYTSGQVWTPFEDPNTNTSCNDQFNANYFSVSACRPFFGNPAAPFSAVGMCTNAAAADCGLIDYTAYVLSGGVTMTPIAKSAVHWIINNDTSAQFFGTPYGNVGRNPPGTRGQPVNTINLNVIKNNRISEKVNLKLEMNVYNLFNHQFLGIPAADITSDQPFFGNYAANDSGGVQSLDSGEGFANAVNTGLAQREFILGAHIIF